MSRIAWKAKCLEDAEWLEGHKEALDEHHVREILRSELKFTDDAKVLRTVHMGLLLALQANLEEGTPKILFGHKSFREFLVGRYWATRFRKLLRENDLLWELKVGEPLLQGRLLGEEDQSFRFMQEHIARWEQTERQRIVDWAQHCFNNEQLAQSSEGFRDDRRSLLREAALAVGSALEPQGMRAKDERTLRSLITWFWLHEIQLILLAPRLHSPQAKLTGCKLSGAILSGANLSGAILSETNLSGANLSGVNLSGTILIGTDLSQANLSGANLSGAILIGTDLSQANLSGANLSQANLSGANLIQANLFGTDLRQAALSGADLRQAALSGADLSGADLLQANLSGANLSGANLIQANLFGTDLGGANLSGADLSGANLLQANLPQAKLEAADLESALID